MTIWQPNLADRGSVPAYVALADAIERDLAAGRLEPGARLPTHRRLARALGVTVGTVTRGYAEAERRGLTIGEVGRGTFVRQSSAAGPLAIGGDRPDAAGLIDLSLSLPCDIGGAAEGEALRETLREIAGERSAARLLAYTPESATASQREVFAATLRMLGVPARPDSITCTVGVQHGLTLIASALLRPGDTLLCGALTYPGARALGQLCGLKLRPVEIDEEGMCPDAIESACRAEAGAAALYVVPNIQNPTNAVLSAARRQRLAEIAAEHDLLVIEDDVHGFLMDDRPPPIASFAPDRTVYATSLAKALTTGLRTGVLHAPDDLVARLRAAVRSSVWMPPPLMQEVTARWLASGTAERIMTRKRAETRARQSEAVEALTGLRVQTHPDSLHLWLHLPDPWRSEQFVDQAAQRGVLVAGAEAFVVGRGEVPHAVRVSTGRAADRAELRRGLAGLVEVLHGSTNPCATIL